MTESTQTSHLQKGREKWEDKAPFSFSLFISQLFRNDVYWT